MAEAICRTIAEQAGLDLTKLNKSIRFVADRQQARTADTPISSAGMNAR